MSGQVVVVTAGPAVETFHTDPCLVAQVRGEMDHLTNPIITPQILELVNSGAQCIVLDMSGVQFCDSSGLNVLLAARRDAERAGATLALACLPSFLRQLLRMTGVDQVLRLYDTVMDAEAALVG
ncbi:STAS domain-containing protein [Streptomyces sp. NPDC046759]|uniref:STAS domain-containing protein n=1 Tax=Streptomyces sp. NPDC046759 TaxID=3155019 RepID=UPI0033E06D09